MRVEDREPFLRRLQKGRAWPKSGLPVAGKERDQLLTSLHGEPPHLRQNGLKARLLHEGSDHSVAVLLRAQQRRKHLYDATIRGTLAKARKEAGDVRARARLGTDVVAEVKAAKAAAAARGQTLAKLAKEYLTERRPDWRPRYFLEVERQLTKDWAPLAGTPIKAIGRQAVVEVVDDIAKKQGKEYLRNLKKGS